MTQVLVIDDDQDYQASVKALLERHGYTVSQAESGRDGLKKLRECHPDAVLLDVMMESDVEGYVVNQAIKYQDAYGEHHQIPVIMVSSIQEAPDERFPMAPEVELIRPDLYLTKPLDLEKLLEVLAKAVRGGHDG